MSARGIGASKTRRAPWALCALLALCLGGPTATTGRAQDNGAPTPAPGEATLELTASISSGFAVAAHRIVDVDGDGRHELLVLGAAGEVRVWRTDEAGLVKEKPDGVLQLPRPDRSLVAVADLTGAGDGQQLVVVSPDGLTAYRFDATGSFEPDPIRLARRARFPLRVGTPRFADIILDANSDGRMDVIVPTGDICELWMNEGPDAKVPFRKAASVPVQLRREESMRAERLSDTLESSLRVPRLTFKDLNNDGRKDLVVVYGKHRAFHMQDFDGVISHTPDVDLDLNVFEDTTPKAELRLGRTLAGNDNQRFESTDLDGDGITDYVIAHRRKVWVFHGDADGPQFERPSVVLKVSQDVTAMLLADVDQDDQPDLVLLRVQVPTVATIIRGLVATWSIEASAVAYRNADGRSFEKQPRPEWQTNVTFNLPAIIDIMRNPDSLVKRFEEVGRKFRRAGAGDLDGDGAVDVALFDDDGAAIEIWRGVAKKGDTPMAPERGQLIAELLFKEREQVWDIDRMLEWLGDQAQQNVARITGGRPAEVTYPLRAGRDLGLGDVMLGDLNGDGRDEIVVSYTRRGVSPETVFDVLSLR